jgi:hypothetical protein
MLEGSGPAGGEEAAAVTREAVLVDREGWDYRAVIWRQEDRGRLRISQGTQGLAVRRERPPHGSCEAMVVTQVAIERGERQRALVGATVEDVVLGEVLQVVIEEERWWQGRGRLRAVAFPLDR